MSERKASILTVVLCSLVIFGALFLLGDTQCDVSIRIGKPATQPTTKE
jgi:hypothetical protein